MSSRKRKPRGPYVAPDPATFPLPTERDLAAVCAYLGKDVPSKDDIDRIVRHLEEREGNTETAAIAAIDRWIAREMVFDPEPMSDVDETELLRARQVHWLAELLALHYRSADTAERKAGRLGLKTTRDYYRRLNVAQGVLAAGVLAANLPQPSGESPGTDNQPPPSTPYDDMNLDPDLETDEEVDDDGFALDEFDSAAANIPPDIAQNDDCDD